MANFQAPSFPTMNPRELADHIRSGPAELVLLGPLRFRRRTRSNPCDFNEFLQALQSSKTIRTVKCRSQLLLSISEDEWVLLGKTLGSVKGIEDLSVRCTQGSRDFHPFQAVADALKNAQSLCKLCVSSLGDGETFPTDPSGLTALANALREHTSLQEFSWIDCSLLGIAHTTAVDPVLWALPACPHLRKVTIMTKCASADAVKNLLRLGPAIDLRVVLDLDLWLAVADGVRQGRCNIKYLHLDSWHSSSSEASNEAVKAIASAIRQDRSLEHLTLEMMINFTDEAGVALAEALTVNKTLRKITLSVDVQYADDADALSAPAYEAFSVMLRVNTSLMLEVPPFDDDAGGDERLDDSRYEMRIEQRLNKVGRGRLLSSSQTPRKEWVDALNELNSYVAETPEFIVSCLYRLLRLNPSACLLGLHDATNSSL
jgi:hypothetical protein